MNIIPEIEVDPAVSVRGQLIGVDDIKGICRNVLKTWVDSDKLYSLDEMVGTIVALTSVALATGALLFDAFKFSLGWLSAVSTILFWVIYRYAKAKHSIELRLAVISGFVIFLLFSTFYIVAIIYTFIAKPYPEEFQTMLTFPFSLVILAMWLLLQVDYPKGAVRRLWSKISKEPVKYRRGGSSEDSLRKSVEALALIAYPVSVSYGAFASVLILVSVFSPLDVFSSMTVVIASAFFFIFLVNSYRTLMNDTLYESRLIDVATSKDTYLGFLSTEPME